VEEKYNETVCKKPQKRSKRVQHDPIGWALKDAACSPFSKTTPLKATRSSFNLSATQSSPNGSWMVNLMVISNRSLLKSPNTSWRISSTPTSAKRKTVEVRESHTSPARKKKRCARPLLFDKDYPTKNDTSLNESTNMEDSSWQQSFTSIDQFI
jgi:hypothetical protein